MKRLRNKLLTCISKDLLRVLILSCMLLGFSGVAWSATIYFKSNGTNNWGEANAWFLAHFWSDGGSSQSIKMSSIGDGYYSCEVPSGKTKVMFFRKDPASSEIGTSSGNWNQTGDLTIPTDGKNLFTPNGWTGCTGDWSTYEEEDLPDALPDAVSCAKKNVLFLEDFGTLTDAKARKENNAIDGQNFYTSYTYVEECAKIKNAGDYAIVATPRWSGCSSSHNADYTNTCSCGNEDTGKWWYNEYYDHTDDDANNDIDDDKDKGLYGGMLQFDCRNGSTTDVLYQRTVSGVCSNTLVNFSAWVTKANVSDADPIKARFILRKGGADGTIIGRKDIDDIKINEGWKQISAIFNSGTLNANGEITIQLINLAPYGKNGNDILLDDLELSVCTPAATLRTSNGTSSITITSGQPETLTAELVSGVMTNPFYLWQYKDDIQDWTPVLNANGEPASGINKVTATVVPARPTTHYRVIVAPKEEDAYKVAGLQANTIPCGMYAETTEAIVTVEPLVVTIEPKNTPICKNTRGGFVISVTNNTGKAVSNVKLRFIPPTDMKTAVSSSPTAGYDATTKVWTITSLPAGTSTFTYDALALGVGTLTAQAHISAIGNAEYPTYDDPTLPPASKDDTTIDVKHITFEQNPDPVTVACEDSEVSFTAKVSTESSASCKGTVKYQWVRRTKGSTGNFTPIDGATKATYTIEKLTKTDAGYEYAVWANIDGCPCTNVKSENATIDFVEKTAKPTDYSNYMKCQKDGKQSFSALFEGTKWDPSKLTFYETLTSTEPITEFDTNIPGSTDYYFTYTEGENCESDRATFNVQILPTPKAEITSGGEQKICTAEATQEFSIAATYANGTGKWEVTKVVDEKGKELSNSVVTIADVTQTETTATLPKGTVATLTWKVTSPGEKCFVTAETTLTAYEEPVLVFEANQGTQAVCAKSDFTVSVEEHAGTGSWEIVGDNHGADFDGPTTNRTAQVKGLTAGETITLKYTAVNGNCKQVTITCDLTNEICNDLAWEAIAANPSKICLNGEVDLTFTVKNNSTVTSTGVVATIALPSGLEYVETLSKTGNYNAGLWEMGDLAKQATATLKIKVKGTIAGNQQVVATIKQASGNTLNKQQTSTVTVHALPTATFAADASEICGDVVGETSNIGITFNGQYPYTLTYDVNGKEKELTSQTATAYITDALTAKGDYTYTLKSIVDGNQCTGLIVGQTHTLTVDKYPTLGDIDPLDPFCEERLLTFPKEPDIDWNGSTKVSQGWTLNKVAVDNTYQLSTNDNNKPLQYAVTAMCGATKHTVYTTTDIEIEVDKKPSDATIDLEEIKQCNDPVFNVTAHPITVGSGVWSIVSGDVTQISPIDNSVTQITLADTYDDKEATVKWTVSNRACGSKSDVITLKNYNCTSFTLVADGEGPKVCYGKSATFTFTLTNTATVDVKNVTLQLTLDAGLELQEATAGGYSFVANECVIPSMKNGEEIQIVVVAKATKPQVESAAYQAEASIKVTKSSDKTVADVEESQAVNVWKLPTATFDAKASEICASELELTAIQVNFTGAPQYVLTYTVDGITHKTPAVSTPYDLKEALTNTGSYPVQLVSVTDGNGCVGSVKNQEHTVTVEKYATLKDLTGKYEICEGDVIALPNDPDETANGSTINNREWKLDDVTINSNSKIAYTKDEQSLWYQLQSTCGTYTKLIKTNSVPLYVDRKPTEANAGADQVLCNATEFVLAANQPDASKGESGKWTVNQLSAVAVSFGDVTDPKTKATGIPTGKKAIVTWTISSKLDVCEATTDDVMLTNNNCTNFDLKGVEVEGTDLIVCDGDDATFTFTLKNNGVAVEDVTLELALGSGLEYKSSTVARTLTFDSNNQCVVPKMAAGEEISITVKAKATIDQATATVKLTKSSNVSITGVTAVQKVTVHELPQIAFEEASSVICIDDTYNSNHKEKTGAKVLFTAGEPTYKLSYDVVTDAGSTSYQDDVTGEEHLIVQTINADATIQLKKVEDEHGCVTKYDEPLKHLVQTKKHATLSELIAPDAVCEQSTLELQEPTVTSNGATYDSQKWVLETVDSQTQNTVQTDFDKNTKMVYEDHHGKQLFYQITSYCNGLSAIVPSNKVDITVYEQPEKPNAGEDQAKCGIGEFTMDASEATAGSGKWVVVADSEEEWVKNITWSDETDPEATITGVPAGQKVDLMWVVTNGTCTSTYDYVSVTHNIVPQLEDVIKSVNTLNKDSVGYAATIDLTCNDDSLYLTPMLKEIDGKPYPTPEKLSYSWQKLSDDGSSYEAYGEGKLTEIVTEQGTYQVKVKDSVTGCESNFASVTINDKKTKPVITTIESFTMNDKGEATDVKRDSITCYNPVLVLKSAVTSVNEVVYTWSTGSNQETTQVSAKGEYTLIVTDTKSGCPSDKATYFVDENKRTPVIDDIISANATSEKVEGYKETQVINCKDTELFLKTVVVDELKEGYKPEDLNYVWEISVDDAKTFIEHGTAPETSVKTKSILSLVVTDKVSGCSSEQETIHIQEYTEKPVITLMESVSTIDPSATQVVKTDTLTCYNPVLYLKPSVSSVHAVSYKWNDESTKDFLKVEKPGTYSVVVTDTETFCSADEYPFSIKEYKRTPVIDDIISANAKDEKVEGYQETKIINCKDTELFVESKVVDTVQEGYEPHELNYQWSFSANNGASYTEYGIAPTFSTQKQGIYKLVVTDKKSGCPAEAKTIEITEVKTTPVITAVTSSSTQDPTVEGAVITDTITCSIPVLYLTPEVKDKEQQAYSNAITYQWTETAAPDNVLSTDSTYNVSKKGNYQLVVTDKTTFCSSAVYTHKIDENVVKPVLKLDETYDLCPSDTLLPKTLSSLLPQTEGINYTFYDESGTKIEDVYEVSSESPVTTYYVTGTATNGCSSDKESFNVDFAKNVDFTLHVSQESVLVGAGETVVTVIPDADSDEADTYTWKANNQPLDVEGMEYAVLLYLNTEFEVTGTNRCGSKTQKASVEVTWPTAFTPYNDNGLNETFAKGLPLAVFNRFGIQIYEGEDGWDGVMNMNMGQNTLAVPGVYYYAVQLPDGNVKKGTIEIVKF